MDNGAIVAKVRAVAEKAAADRQIELVHVDISGTKRDSVVRIYIDKEGGVTLEDCTNISRDVEAVLDVEDFIPTRYVLEVSSPGIERELYSIEDFRKFAGRLAKIKMREPIDGQKTFVGTIEAVDAGTVTLMERTKGLMTVDYADISKGNLRIDLSQEFKGR